MSDISSWFGRERPLNCLISRSARLGNGLKAAAVLGLLVFSAVPAAAQVAEATTASHEQKSTTSAKAPVVFDLEEIQTDMAAGGAAVNGLRQKVLLNEPQCMIVLLSFERDGRKESHSAPGVATITVVEGSIEFRVEGKTHSLKAGQVIVLQPHVEHDLQATEKAMVLVNISKGQAAPVAAHP